jgi:hypothetical protein
LPRSGPTDGAPHGVAPLSSSLPYVALPRRMTRSFLGFAFKQALVAVLSPLPAPSAGLLSNTVVCRDSPRRMWLSGVSARLFTDESVEAAGGRSVRAKPKLHLEAVTVSVPPPKVRCLTRSTQAVSTEVVRLPESPPSFPTGRADRGRLVCTSRHHGQHASTLHPIEGRRPRARSPKRRGPLPVFNRS